MKKFLLLLLILVAGFAVYWFKFRSSSGGDNGPKQQPLEQKKHSGAFNESVDTMMTAYFDLSNAFVDADTVKVKAAGLVFAKKLDSLKMDDLRKDTVLVFAADSLSLVQIKMNLQSLLVQTDITEMRKDFKMVNENLYPFLKGINYSGKKLYWYNCGMPFGENTSANWISPAEKKANPYLGKNHPEYKGSMLECGELQDTIVAK